ncbi:hypothetical protein K1T71_014424 [Dendrolimus kikuchii]|uniref:Uncharacterized protein n=1 Tax=Dendrolimus kikuchii TaxID=765133 RepID=A0ACC1CDY8_9NEOP|nr:hypothetical protein K1T71_014424 [Dendrolimus kikuchii]
MKKSKCHFCIDSLLTKEKLWFHNLFALRDNGGLINVSEAVYLIYEEKIFNAAPDTPESHYTDIHVRTRNIIERTIGLLKARFRCLLVHRVLHYKPEMAGSITNACVILHNICNKAKISVPNLSNEDMLREAQLQIAVTEADSEGTSTNTQALQQGIAIRNTLVHRLWDARRI